MKVFVGIVGRNTARYVPWTDEVRQLSMPGYFSPIALTLTSCDNVNLMTFDEVIYPVHFPALCEDAKAIPVFKHDSYIPADFVGRKVSRTSCRK